MEIKKAVILLLSVILSFSTAFPQKGISIKEKKLIRKEKNTPVYFFSYFTGKGKDGLHLMYSYDGLYWRALNNGKSLLKPEVGKEKLIRDPSVVRDKKGIFHMVWTCGWTERSIGYASSKDLIHWTEQKEIPVMEKEPKARNAWAPEIYYNKHKNLFYIYWSTTIPGRFPVTGVVESNYNHRIYYVTTKDFKTFSETKLFYDPGFCVIDAFIIKDDFMYYMFIKNETKKPVEKNIRMVNSRKITDFPKKVSAPLTGKAWAEGPTAIKIGDYTYLYWDKYRNKSYGALRCKDLSKGRWENISKKISFPAGVRHGTAFKGDEYILKGLEALRK